MWANIKAIIAGIQVISALLSQLRDWYDAYQLKKIEKHYKIKKSAIDSLTSKIAAEVKKEAPSDEVIKNLHRRLTSITIK